MEKGLLSLEIQQCQILFSDESWFCFERCDSHVLVCKRLNEGYAKACVIERDLFRSGSKWSREELPIAVVQATEVMSVSVAQLDALSDWRQGGRGFNPRRGRQHSFVEIDHEIFSMVILSRLLIQEGQLSVSGERMCTILVNPLED